MKDHKTLLQPYIQPKDIGQTWLESNMYYPNYIRWGYEIAPENILELGVRYGYSLLCFIYGSYERWIVDEKTPSFKIYGIDFEDESGSNLIAQTNIQSFLLSNRIDENTDVKILNKLTYEVSPQDVNENKFDLIHLDANHSFKVLNELQAVWPLLKDGGYLILDDMGSGHVWNDWVRTKRSHVDNFLQRFVSFSQIESIKFENTYRGTYIVKKSQIASSYGVIT